MLGSFAANLYTLIILHWVIYAVTTTILVVTLRSVLGEGAHVFSLSVFESYTVLHTMLTILMASTMGIPPFAGFWTKLYILVIIGRYGTYLTILYTTVLMLISMLYYITVLRYSTPVAEIRMRIYAITTKQITLTLVGCILVTFSVPFLFDMFIIILGSII